MSSPTRANDDGVVEVNPGAVIRSQTYPVDNLCSDKHANTHTGGYRSPLRQHQRTLSLGPHYVKETFNASLQYGDDVEQGLRINQYTIKEEIGRGSFGAVHVAVDSHGQQYAIKEFSKARLRKRSQSNILRRPHMARGKLGSGQNPIKASFHRRSVSQIQNEEENGNPMFLIREEIAIMKKLDHPNVVKLYEVLDDPDGDSLFMVMEMCPKGVVMKVALGESALPYPIEKCRHWFRDMVLGIEYLHSQGIIHRDIKPDNLLLADDDCLKIVDFGVSEMFKEGTGMLTAKSAGSPAFLPPELCKAGHGDVSGEAADVWAMGVTLYCLCFGRLPFDHLSILDLYEAIITDAPTIPTQDAHLVDLFTRLLEKDPLRRIKLTDLRNHPWVTCCGCDPLLSREENTSAYLEPTPEEVQHAITKRIRHIMTIVKAVNKLKQLTAKNLKRRLMQQYDVSTPRPPSTGLEH